MSDALSAYPPNPDPDPDETPSPTEVEYAAIADALAETRRGRWFLEEHARRTRLEEMDLLALILGRIEVAVADFRDETVAKLAQPAVPPTLVDTLPKALGRIEERLA
ncbi:hypothetical protein CCR97_27335, partial [Rhodoplanes elegans]|nr:hypothetical protein [Rhodoplanes elegans]